MNPKTYSILAIFYLGLSLVSGDLRDDKTIEWRKIHELAYDKKVPRPEEKLDLLKRLDELFPYVWLNKHDVIDWQRERRLIELANIKPDKCSLMELIEFDCIDMIDKNFHSKFLGYYKGQQFNACKPEAYRKLEEAVNKIGKEDKDDVAQLTEEVLKYNRTRLDEAFRVRANFDALTRGSLDFMKQKHQQLSKTTPKEEIEKLFSSSVVSLCKTIIKRLKGPLEFYRLLFDARQPEVDKIVEHPAIDWKVRHNVCELLTKDHKYILDVAIELMHGDWKPGEELLDPRDVLWMEKTKQNKRFDGAKNRKKFITSLIMKIKPFS